MKYDYYERLINKKTTGRCDVTPLFNDPKVFGSLINDLIRPFKGVKIDKVVGLDALGFILGGAVALRAKKGFVPIRKGGKLLGVAGTLLKTSFVDYSKRKKTFEMNKGSIKKGDRVLIVDEWIETGAQAFVAIRLIERQGGRVIGITVLNADRTKKTEGLFREYNLKGINVNVQNN